MYKNLNWENIFYFYNLLCLLKKKNFLLNIIK